MFSFTTEEDWKPKSEDVASFKMATIRHSTLRNEDVLHEGYRPKMLLYALDELFYSYDQVKHHRGVDEKLIVAYEILGLMCCAAWNAEDGWKNRVCQTACCKPQ